MTDFNILNKALKVAWIPRIKSENVASWKIIPNVTLERYGGLQIKHDIEITMFQYRIIHNTLATKLSLFRANFSDNDVCPQCLAEAHSLDHMFLRYSSVVAYWKTFQNWWTNKTKEQLTSNSMILYGVFEKNGT